MNALSTGAFPHQLYAALAPWMLLALLLLGRNPYPSRIRVVGSLLLAFFALRIPVEGWHLFAWVRVLEPDPSLTFTLLLAVALLRRATGRALFRPSDWSAAVLFGAIAALLLYPTALGLTSHDAYGWGWGRALPVAVTALAALLVALGNRFGLVLIVPVALRVLRVGGADNFWDAVIDPAYAILSLLAVVGWSIRSGLEMRLRWPGRKA